MTTREKWIEALKQFLIAEGAINLSVRSLAKFAGMNHGLVHHYFGSLENLIIEAINSVYDRVKEDMQVVQTSNRDKQKLKEILAKEISSGELGYLQAEFLVLSGTFPQVKKFIQSILEERRQFLMRFFELENKQDGYLVLAAIQGVIMHSRILPEFPVSDLIQALFSRLIAAKE